MRAVFRRLLSIRLRVNTMAIRTKSLDNVSPSLNSCFLSSAFLSRVLRFWITRSVTKAESVASVR